MSDIVQFLPLLILVAIVALIVRAVARGLSKKQLDFICTTCGTKAKPKTHTRGSLAIEIVLWLLLIVPGLIYSIWRQTSKQSVCVACKNATLIPLDTPAGQKYARDFAK